MSTKDIIYHKAFASIADFAFDQSVVEVFPDMIERSVPGYNTIIAMTGVIASRYAQPDSHYYDLGSSLGASTLSMCRQLNPDQGKIIAVDNSAAMLQRCREIIAASQGPQDIVVELQLADIRDVSIENAAVVVLNFTLQFVPPADRQGFLQTIYRGMRPGAVLLLSEKILFDDAKLQQLNTALHHEFKRANGYSDLEISQKRSAIENVLIPETIDTHQRRLQEIGFSSVDVWFQCFNFASMVAIK